MQGMRANVVWEYATALAFILIFLGVGYIVGRGVSWAIPPGGKGKPRWPQTLVTAMTWANIGDLPFTFFLSYGDIAPFRPGDMALGMAIVTMMGGPYNFTFFSLFGPRMIGRDWETEGEKGKEREEEMEREVIQGFGGMQAMDLEDIQTAESGMTSNPSESIPWSSTSPTAGATLSQGSITSHTSTTAIASSTIAPQRNLAYASSQISASQRKKHLIHHRIWRFLRRAWTPMNACLLLGLIIGLTPPLRRLFAADDPRETAPLEWLEVDLALLGAISLPLSCVNMGAVCTRGSLRDVPRRQTLAFFLIRLLCFPALALGLGYAACAMGWIGWDRYVLRMYILLIACAPPTMPCLLAIQGLTEGTGVDRQVTSMTGLLYVASLFTSVTYIFILLYLMSY